MAPQKLFTFVFCYFAFVFSVEATNVVIIESQSYGHTMDNAWLNVCTGLGYNATIYPQTELDVNTWFANTDFLIVSSGVIPLTAGRINTIQSYLAQGGRVYLQTEYDCGGFETNAAFEQIVNALGGSYNWQGITAGDLSPMNVLGSLSNTPYSVSPLSYFWYGCAGLGNGCNSYIEPFLQYGGQYFGFIFCVPGNGSARMITTSDQDWVQSLTSTTLMQNIAVNLSSPSYNCVVSNGGLNVNLGNDTSICPGNNLNLNGYTSGATSYLWSTGANSSSITVNTPGTYWVQVSNNSCIASDTLHVLPGNGPPFSFLLSSPLICQGDSATLTFSGAINATIFPTNNIDWYDTAHAILHPDSTTAYILTAQNTCGNVDTATAVLTVSPPPVAQLTADTNLICVNDSAHICVTGNYSAYAWSTGESAACIYAHLPGNYYATVTDNNQCTAISNQLSVSIYIAPPFNVLLSDTQICKGDSAMLTLTGALNASIFPLTGVSWQDSVHATLRPDSTTLYTLSAQNTCGNMDTASVLLKIFPVTNVLLTQDTNIVCTNDSAQICVGGNFISYLWNIGQNTQCVFMQPSRSYYVMVTDNNQCTVESNHVSLSVYPAPYVYLSVNDDTLYSVNAVSYQWYRNDISISGATLSWYVAAVPGNYSVAIVDSNGCRASTIPVSIIPATIASITGAEIKIYPNPLISGNWQLIVPANMVGGKIEVYDASGRIVFESEISHIKSDLNFQVARGVYYLHVYSNQTNALLKLIRM